MKLPKSEAKKVWGIDTDEYGYIVNLSAGWRFADDVVHTRGFDRVSDAREDIRAAISCDCEQCRDEKANNKCVREGNDDNN